jgi:hypothetical protein
MTSSTYRFVAVLAFWLAFGLDASAAPAGTLPTTSPAATVHKKVAYSQYVQASTVAALERLADDHDYPAAKSAIQALFDQAILYAPDEHLDCIRQTDFARRLVNQLTRVPPETRDELLPYLLKHQNLAATLVFLLHPDHEMPAQVYELLQKLRTQRPDQMDTYASLAAAICVVQHRPFEEGINENHATSADAIDIFDYYVRNESRMFFGIRNVPAELLVYVVDTTASIPDMEWALNKYAGTQDVGSLFFTINYDYDYLKSGKDKKLTVNGFNLPNILKYGGVCIDQAYFAATVGKSIGVPTAIDYGTSGEAAHAWVGFLQFNGRDGFWNFDSGRYQDYQSVRGSVRDPQTRGDIPDCYVTLLSEITGTRAVDRQNAVALTDASARLSDLEANAASGDVTPPPADAVASSTFSARPRARDVEAQLALIESALRQSVADMPAWFTVRELAVAKKLNLDQKRRWSDVLLRLGAAKYPDFTLSVLMPMVKTVDDPQQQNQLLTNLLPLFRSRLDLSAMIKMSEAELFESQNQPDLAGQCYMDVVQQYANGGPFVLGALKGAEKLLKSTNRGDNVVLLYQQAWSRTTKPEGEAQDFVAESNWFRIGRLYAQKLAAAGDSNKAAEVRTQLGFKSGDAAGD